MELPELFYCEIHQTLQEEPDCEVCIEQDGTGPAGIYARSAGLPEQERQAIWAKLAKENHKRLDEIYGKK